jgi:hypothetical protein
VGAVVEAERGSMQSAGRDLPASLDLTAAVGRLFEPAASPPRAPAVGEARDADAG